MISTLRDGALVPTAIEEATFKPPPTVAAFATLREVSVPKLVILGCAAVLSVPATFVAVIVVALRVRVLMVSELMVLFPFVMLLDVRFVKYPACDDTETDEDTCPTLSRTMSLNT